MWRYLAGAAAAMLLMSAGMLFFRSGSAAEVPVLPAAPVEFSEAPPLPDEAPRASAKSREEKRFDRYDKDRNDSITREEYLASRRKAFAKLDTNGDGRLSFEEWAVRTTTKFATADRDKSGTLNRAEFATTAVQRKAPARKAKCECPPPARTEGGVEE
jgi:hypothetical protein